MKKNLNEIVHKEDFKSSQEFDWFVDKLRGGERCYAELECNGKIFFALSSIYDMGYPKTHKNGMKELLDHICNQLGNSPCVTYLNKNVKRYVEFSSVKILELNVISCYEKDIERFHLESEDMKGAYSCCERKILSMAPDNLVGAKLYVAYEPCFMCAPALKTKKGLDVFALAKNKRVYSENIKNFFYTKNDWYKCCF